MKAKKRYIKILVRWNPWIAWKAVRHTVDNHYYTNTLRKAFREVFLKKWKYAKRIALMKGNTV